MTTQQARSGKAEPATYVTTNTGRILRVNPADAAAVAAEAAASSANAQAAAAHPAAMDPARRADVLFRVRRDEGHEISAWWMVGAFLLTSGLVIALLNWVPYSA